MKHIIVLMFAYAMSSNVIAGTVYQDVTQSGIIPPDVATGGDIFYEVAVSKQGDILVCPQGIARIWNSLNVCVDSNNENRWLRMIDAVPKGRTYVGFRFRGSGKHVEVYWK